MSIGIHPFDTTSKASRCLDGSLHAMVGVPEIRYVSAALLHNRWDFSKLGK